MSKYEHIQQEAYEANKQLPVLGLVLFTFGNVSAADRSAGVFAIKPSGVAYENLSPAKMVVVDFDGKMVEGTLRPSSDTLTHAVLYKHWGKIGGIAHTHSTYATAWAQARRDIPVFGTTHAQIGAYVLGLWGLPDGVVSSVDLHHEPRAAALSGFTPLLAVHAAQCLHRDAGLNNRLDTELIEQLGMKERIPLWEMQLLN